MPAQNEHHLVALLDAQTDKEVGRLLGKAGDLGKGEGALAAVHVRPLQGALVRLFLGDDVEHVVGKVEVLGNVDAEIVQKILIGAEFRLPQKALVERHGVC